MKLIGICILILPLLLVIAPPPVKGQLEAILAPTKLPRPMYGAAFAYDGDEFIYLLGGFPEHQEILRYSISSGVIELVGTNPAFHPLGTAEIDRNGNPIFLSATATDVYDYRDVVRFNRHQNSTELLATHNYSKQFAASVKNADVVFIIGGDGKKNGLLTFDTATSVSTVRTNLNASIYNPAAVRVGAAAFVFSYSGVLKIDLETFSSEVIVPGFPHLEDIFRAVYDGRNIYIIGGHKGAQVPTGGIIQFNPDSYDWKFVPVEDFPVSGSTYFIIAPESVYVEKLNRIYMFGGLIGYNPGLRQDGIWYIDLNSENSTTTELPPDSTTLIPDTFCVNRPNGMYPHPAECDMFLGCRDEVLTIFTCHPPLLFHPDDRGCYFPEDVDCQTH